MTVLTIGTFKFVLNVQQLCITTSLYSHAVGSDYDRVDEELTFTPTESRRCFDVSLFDDDLLELPETIDLALDSDDSMVILSPDQAQVIINDTDRKFLSLYTIAVW